MLNSYQEGPRVDSSASTHVRFVTSPCKCPSRVFCSLHQPLIDDAADEDDDDEELEGDEEAGTREGGGENTNSSDKTDDDSASSAPVVGAEDLGPSAGIPGA